VGHHHHDEHLIHKACSDFQNPRTSGIAIVLSTLLVGSISTTLAAPPNDQKFKFMSYAGDPKKTAPNEMTFQVNRLDVGQPTDFVKLGDYLRGTHFKVIKFQYKTRAHPNAEGDDISELTLLDTTTKETVVLPLAQIVRAESKLK
jgi:hypothetical protein